MSSTLRKQKASLGHGITFLFLQSSNVRQTSNKNGAVNRGRKERKSSKLIVYSRAMHVRSLQ